MGGGGEDGLCDSSKFCCSNFLIAAIVALCMQ